MSNFLSGTTIFVSIDNVCFAFQTECIVKSPLNAFIAYYTGFRMINDIKIISLSLFSNVIQTYILLETGVMILPLSYNNYTINNIHPNIETKKENNDVLYDKAIFDDNMMEVDNSSNLELDDDLSKLIETDDNFSDFNSYLQDSSFGLLDLDQCV